MAEPVNLRAFRKRKARADKERVAESNRIAHGRGKMEKAAAKAERTGAAAFIEGHRRDRSGEGAAD